MRGIRYKDKARVVHAWIPVVLLMDPLQLSNLDQAGLLVQQVRQLCQDVEDERWVLLSYGPLYIVTNCYFPLMMFWPHLLTDWNAFTLRESVKMHPHPGVAYNSPRNLVLPEWINRASSYFLHRLHTGCAFAQEQPLLLGLSDTLDSSSCGIVGDLGHPLWVCSAHSSSRDKLLLRIRHVGNPCNSAMDPVFPACTHIFSRWTVFGTPGCSCGDWPGPATANLYSEFSYRLSVSFCLHYFYVFPPLFFGTSSFSLTIL